MYKDIVQFDFFPLRFAYLNGVAKASFISENVNGIGLNDEIVWIYQGDRWRQNGGQ